MANSQVIIEKEQPVKLEESQEGVASQKPSEECELRHQVSFKNSHFPKLFSDEHLSYYCER